MCCARWVPLVLMRTAVSLSTPSTLPGNAECNFRWCGELWRYHVLVGSAVCMHLDCYTPCRAGCYAKGVNDIIERSHERENPPLATLCAALLGRFRPSQLPLRSSTLCHAGHPTTTLNSQLELRLDIIA
jgi:hypothetical protein